MNMRSNTLKPARNVINAILIIFFVSNIVIGSIYTGADNYDKNNDVTQTVASTNLDVNLTVETDQPYYYPEEYVNIFGRTTVNGKGIPTRVCCEVKDPNASTVFQMCFETNNTGYYSVGFTLEPDAILGIYTVKAECSFFNATANTTFIVVSTTVEADADGPYEGIAGEPIQFYGNVTGGKPPYTWHWDFDDGTNTTDQNPLHTYDSVGTYTVNLTVTDNGSHWGYNLTTATVNPSPPNLNITNIRGPLGINAIVENTGTTDATNVEWSIKLEKGIILLPLGRIKEDTLDEIKAGEELSISTFVFGFGRVNITIQACTTECIDIATVSGFVLGPFAFIIK